MQNTNPSTPENKELNFFEALIPIVFLMSILSYNVFFQGGEAFGLYSYHIILIAGALVAAVVGFFNQVTLSAMLFEIWENFRSVFIPILILFLVGALAGSWLISGVIPTMVFYGLKLLRPSIFLPSTIIICSIISIAVGSSWNTSATVGIALVGVGIALGFPPGMVAGAVISGAYFGDKMSPMSDTTNLAPAMAGTKLFTHIRYMTYTTVPTWTITLIIFSILGITTQTQGQAELSELLINIEQTFTITPLLFIVPVVVILFIVLKAHPLIALGVGVVLASIFAFIFQKDILSQVSDNSLISILQAVFSDIQITTSIESLNKLFSSGGMKGMLWTIYLILAAMIFGGVMDAIGALSRITQSLLSVAKTQFGLFASTVASCLGVNIAACDQYLSIVIPGKMFKEAYKERDLAAENLSRTLEDSGTVTSVLIPWNTGGVYQSTVLGVDTAHYLIYCIFNWLSPIMTLVVAGLGIKIRSLAEAE